MESSNDIVVITFDVVRLHDRCPGDSFCGRPEEPGTSFFWGEPLGWEPVGEGDPCQNSRLTLT